MQFEQFQTIGIGITLAFSGSRPILFSFGLSIEYSTRTIMTPQYTCPKRHSTSAPAGPWLPCPSTPKESKTRPHLFRTVKTHPKDIHLVLYSAYISLQEVL